MDENLDQHAWKQAKATELAEERRRTKGTPSNGASSFLFKDEYKDRFMDSWKYIRQHNLMYEDYAEIFARNDRIQMQRVLIDLWVLVGNLNTLNQSLYARHEFQLTFRLVERVLVALQGHWQPQAREKAIRMLNVLYDGVDWQKEEAHNPAIRSIGDEFTITTRITSRVTQEDCNIKILVCGPSFDVDSPQDHIVTAHDVDIIDDGSSNRRPIDSNMSTGGKFVGSHNTSHTIQLKLKNFVRAGFYDWRVVFVSPDSNKVRPVRFANRDYSDSHAPVFDGKGLAQGRFVVQPKVNLMHEVLVDMEGVQLVHGERGANVITRRGNFKTVEAALESYKKKNFDFVNLVGALERDNGCDPKQIQANLLPHGECSDLESEESGNDFSIGMIEANQMTTFTPGECERPDTSPGAVTDRCIPNHMLGGPRGFSKLVHAANKLDLKISVSIPPYVSSARRARKYDATIAYTLDSEGNKVEHRGTDVKENQWEDTVLLNYRKLETWEMLIDDILNLLDQYNISGLHLVDAQSLPQILSCHLDELCCLEPSGQPMYSAVEILEGHVVQSNHEHGFWATVQAGSVSKYANPIMVKLCRAVWREHSYTTIFGDSAWNRCPTLAASGVLPRSLSLPMALANVHGKTLSKSGIVDWLPDSNTMNVRPLYEYINYLSKLPPGLDVVQPLACCSPAIPYPSLLFGRGVWSMVDLLFMLPGTPMTFIGEEEGRSYRIDLANTYSHNLEWEVEESRRRAQQKRFDRPHSMDYRSNALKNAQPPPVGHSLTSPVNGHIAEKFGNLHMNPIQQTSSDQLGDGVNDMYQFGMEEENRFFFQEMWDDGGDQDLNIQSMPTVRSWANLQSTKYHGSASSGSLAPPRIRSINKLDTMTNPNELHNLEAEHKRSIGPEFGFDLGKIGDHYTHRHMLRSKYEVLRTGKVVPLKVHHRHGVHPNVFAFARWLPFPTVGGVAKRSGAKEVAIIAINFNSHSSMFTIDCSALSKIFGAVPEDDSSPDFVFTMTDLLSEPKDEKDFEIFTPNEAASSSNLVTLQPHRTLAWHFMCKSINMQEEKEGEHKLKRRGSFFNQNQVSDLERRFFRSTLRRLNQLLEAHEKALSRKQNNLNRISGTDGALPDHQLAIAAAKNHIFANLRAAFEKCMRRLATLAAKIQLDGGSTSPASMASTVSTDTSSTATGVPPISTKQQNDDLPTLENISRLQNELIEFSLTGIRKSDVQLNCNTENTQDSSSNPIEQKLNYALQNPDLLSAEMFEVAEPLAEAFHLLVLQLLPRSTIESDTDSELKVQDQDKFLGVSIASEANLTSIVVRALAPIVRKVLFAITKLVPDVEKDRERMLIAFLKFLHRAHVMDDSAAEDAPIRSSQYAAALASSVLRSNELGDVVFIAPELGKWSTVGGLGVMVDELTVGLAALGVRVTVISPFYDRNKKGHRDYLRPDGIHYKRNIETNVGNDRVVLGIHEGIVNGVRVLFLHNATYFPYPYPNGNAWQTLRILILIAKGSLEALCQFHLIPSMIVTNDWFTGLVAAYAKSGAFGTPSVFSNTFFFHIIHNLDPSYEGRIHTDVHEQAAMTHLHGLPPDLLVDPFWAPINQQILLNPSRAALLCSDTWGTVSPSYRDDLLNSSPLATLLHRAPHPFAFVNGIPTMARAEKLDSLEMNTHEKAKGLLQQRYFGFSQPDLSIPMFAFVGRITRQKGVHLILSVASTLIQQCGGRIQFLVGGPANVAEKYAADCVAHMHSLRSRFPSCFWADPDLFFTDGPLVNLGADFGLMPSLFEPSGIVQQEFFIGGTPVIAFRTGGLKDTVFDFNHSTLQGNGFTFQAHTHGDLVYAIQRALDTYAVDHLYATLRVNAKKSVLDLASVCFAWYKEFMRCRKCLIGATPTKIRLPMKKLEDTTVFINGNFTHGKDLSAEYNEEYSEYSRLFYLPDGVYEYHFVINGKVVLASGVPVSKVHDGSKKHVLLVSANVI